MKNILNRLQRNQRGVVLIIVLILLAVGGLTIAPMLSHMSTGLKAGQTYEKKTDEYYAADAGVEAALWQITREQRLPEFPSEYGDSYTWDDEEWDNIINNKNVVFTIEYLIPDADGNDVYKIESTATGDDGGSTRIDSFVTFGGGFGFLLDNAITTPGVLDLQPNIDIFGNVMCGNPEDQDEEYGAEEYVGYWPTADEFSGFYLDDVDIDNPFPDEIINLNGTNRTIGPLYRDGTLEFINSSNTPATLTLNDTVYVTGNFEIPNSKSRILNLNGQTIFVCGNVDIEDSDAKPCTITGSGCIIAVGDIYFKPNMGTTEEDFVLIMSINGTVHFQPSGDYYGSIAGEVSVESQPGGSFTWREPEEGELNFPGADEGDRTGWNLAVRTWETS